MDSVVKKRWLEALRSGKYKQGQGQLRVEDWETGKVKFCCLGVLCDLYLKDRKKGWNYNLKISDDDGSNPLKEQTVLPQAVIRWAQTKSSDPFVGELSLASLNDGGTDFSKIADMIDKHL